MLKKIMSGQGEKARNEASAAQPLNCSEMCTGVDLTLGKSLGCSEDQTITQW